MNAKLLCYLKWYFLFWMDLSLRKADSQIQFKMKQENVLLLVWEKKEDEKMTNSEGLIYFHPSSDKIEENNYFLFFKKSPFSSIIELSRKDQGR